VKYVIIIPDGGADLPIDELGGRSPLEAANLPNLERLARAGRVGSAVTTPPGFEAGSDVCSMSLLGYSPTKYHTGRAPLEAASLGLDPGDTDWIFRLNLVTTGTPGTEQDGLMLDHSAGHITDAEARTLVRDLFAFWQQREPELVKGLALTPGVSYRNILIDSSGRNYQNLQTTPPHAIPGEPWEKYLPVGVEPEQTVLRRLLMLSSELFATHDVNRTRIEHGLKPATMAWIWGQGTKPSVPSFQERFGLKGAMITAVDLLSGIAKYIGWDRLPCKGITSYHDTNYREQGLVTIDALSSYDVVCCHVEAPDESSHQGDWATKVASLESIDREIVGPVMKALERYGDAEKDPSAKGWRVLVMPDHFTLCSTRKHDATPVPFAMAGAWVRSLVKRGFTEIDAASSDLEIDPGHDLMEYFLFGGIPAPRGRR
jgi:2,3-bisphosphoglycerate-independent phosphoglycerate mutase